MFIRKALAWFTQSARSFAVAVLSDVRRALVAGIATIILGAVGIQSLDAIEVGLLDEGFSDVGKLLEQLIEEVQRLTGAVESGVDRLEDLE